MYIHVPMTSYIFIRDISQSKSYRIEIKGPICKGKFLSASFYKAQLLNKGYT